MEIDKTVLVIFMILNTCLLRQSVRAKKQPSHVTALHIVSVEWISKHLHPELKGIHCTYMVSCNICTSPSIVSVFTPAVKQKRL